MKIDLQGTESGVILVALANLMDERGGWVREDCIKIAKKIKEAERVEP